MALQISNFVEHDLDRIEVGEPVAVLLHGYGANERDLPSLVYKGALPPAKDIALSDRARAKGLAMP